MNWLDRIRPKGLTTSKTEKGNSVPEGLWKKCIKCQSPLYRPELERNLDVCPKCGYHMRIGARRRINIFLDEDGIREIGQDIEAIDRLKFKDVKKYTNNVVITGGEPLMWNMNPLTNELKLLGLKTHIETSGAYPLSGNWDWFCLSPKKNKLPIKEVYARADELKIIIHNNDDLRFAQEQAVNVSPDCKLYLQPEWSKREKMMPLIVDYVMKNPQWKVSLQTHKYLNIP